MQQKVEDYIKRIIDGSKERFQQIRNLEVAVKTIVGEVVEGSQNLVAAEKPASVESGIEDLVTDLLETIKEEGMKAEQAIMTECMEPYEVVEGGKKQTFSSPVVVTLVQGLNMASSVVPHIRDDVVSVKQSIICEAPPSRVDSLGEEVFSGGEKPHPDVQQKVEDYIKRIIDGSKERFQQIKNLEVAVKTIVGEVVEASQNLVAAEKPASVESGIEDLVTDLLETIKEERITEAKLNNTASRIVQEAVDAAQVIATEEKIRIAASRVVQEAVDNAAQIVTTEEKIRIAASRVVQEAVDNATQIVTTEEKIRIAASRVVQEAVDNAAQIVTTEEKIRIAASRVVQEAVDNAAQIVTTEKMRIAASSIVTASVSNPEESRTTARARIATLARRFFGRRSARQVNSIDARSSSTSSEVAQKNKGKIRRTFERLFCCVRPKTE